MQIITSGGAPDKQDNADQRDAATSVGGLVTPRSAQQQRPPSTLGSSAKPAATLPQNRPAAAVGASISRDSSMHRSGSDLGRSDSGAPRRSSSSRHGGTDNGSSMEKLHALYARLMSDTASHRRSSTSEGLQQGSSNNGMMRQARRTGGMGSSKGMVAPATSPMRSSVPYPLAVMAGAKQADAADGRRCRSVSPQKEPQQVHALSHLNLQQHQQEQQRQQGYAQQLRHSASFCSSCGGPMHHALSTTANSTALPAGALTGAAAAAPAAASTVGAGVPATAGDAAAMGIRAVSDALPSTHISIAGLLSEGLVAASVAHWEQHTSPTLVQQQQHFVVPGSPARAAVAGRDHSPPIRGRAQQRSQGQSRSMGGYGDTPAGGRGSYSASPVRANRGSPAQTLPARASPDPARRAASSSPHKLSRRKLSTAPAAGSEVVLSREGVGVTQISFGQLLQETALQQAMGQLQQEVTSPGPLSADSSPSSYVRSPATAICCNTPPAASAAAVVATAGAESDEHAGSGLLKESSSAVQVLGTVPEDGVVTVSTTTEAVPRRTHSRSNSRYWISLPAQLDVPPLPEGMPSPAVTATAAAAALQELALANARAEQQHGILTNSVSMPSSGHSGRHLTGSLHSSFADRHCLSASSSMRSRATLSSSSSKVWRPGGTRTDPKDDCKKLQSYESARLRALQRQSLLSPGCSSRLLIPGEDVAAVPGSASPKSRRSTADNLATPVSPGAPTGYSSMPASPGPVSPGGYAAASLCRKNSIAAAAAAGSADLSASLGRTSSSAARPLSAPAARIAAAKPAGPRSVLEPAHTAISLAALASIQSSPPAPQRSASPKLRKQEPKPRQQSPQHQHQQPQQTDVWQSLTGKPCPKILQPMMQCLQHRRTAAGPSHKGTYASHSAHSSPERVRTVGKTHPVSRSYPSGGNSTTAQVEEAIRAAQAALRQKQQQVSQVRQAMSSKWAGPGRAHGLSSARQQQVSEDDGCAGILTDSLLNSSVWGGSSCASSYTGSVAAVAAGKATNKDLAVAYANATQGQHGADAPASAPCEETSGGLPRLASLQCTHSVTEGCEGPSRPGSRKPGGLATVSAPVGGLPARSAAQQQVPQPSKELGPCFQEQSADAAAGTSAESAAVAEKAAVQASAPGPSPASASAAQRPAGSPRTIAKAAHAAPARTSPESPRIKAYKGPVSYHNRHRSLSPKRRPMSALEALLKVSPDADHHRGHKRSSSAEPKLMNQLSAARVGAAAAAPSSRRSSHHSPGQHPGNNLRGSSDSSPFSKAGPQGAGKGVATSSYRRSSGGGSMSSYVAEPWSAPRQRTASGLTGEQLLDLHRRRSLAEAAEAAAAAAEGDTEVAGCAQHTMPLDALVRAYTALNKKNKNSGERAAAVAMLLDRIAEGDALTADSLGGKATPCSGSPAGNAGQASGDSSLAGEQSQQKLRSSPLPAGMGGVQLDVLGRGLLPESPRGVGPGSTAGPTSPSTIIQTLKQDSLSSWHKVSPERQAAHATLLATPKHKHASSYAADLAALAAGRSSTNLGGQAGDKSVHRTDSLAGVAPGSAGKQQHSSNASPAPADGTSSAEQSPLHQTREGSMTGASRACTPLRGVRLSSTNGADASPVQQPEQGAQLASQPECVEPAASPALRLMVETATGRLVLDSIGAHDMTVSAALAWLKAGLHSPDVKPLAQPSAVSPWQCLHPASPRRHVQSRPCSPFACFGANSRSMVRSSDDEAEAAAVVAAAAAAVAPDTQQQHQQQQQQQQPQPGANGVTFEMGSDNRLVMVVQQQGMAAPRRLQVTGARLKPLKAAQQQQPQDGISSSGIAETPADGTLAAASGMSTLDLLTTGGSHTIELASESDWAGLVVGLNAMLLLLEANSPEAAEQLGAMCMSQVVWSKAVIYSDS